MISFALPNQCETFKYEIKMKMKNFNKPFLGFVFETLIGENVDTILYLYLLIEIYTLGALKITKHNYYKILWSIIFYKKKFFNPLGPTFLFTCFFARLALVTPNYPN